MRTRKQLNIFLCFFSVLSLTNLSLTKSSFGQSRYFRLQSGQDSFGQMFERMEQMQRQMMKEFFGDRHSDEKGTADPFFGDPFFGGSPFGGSPFGNSMGSASSGYQVTHRVDEEGNLILSVFSDSGQQDFAWSIKGNILSLEGNHEETKEDADGNVISSRRYTSQSSQSIPSGFDASLAQTYWDKRHKAQVIVLPPEGSKISESTLKEIKNQRVKIAKLETSSDSKLSRRSQKSGNNSGSDRKWPKGLRRQNRLRNKQPAPDPEFIPIPIPGEKI